MPVPKGFKHSAESRKKMSTTRKGISHSQQQKVKIGDANRGKVRVRKYSGVCPCGKHFVSGAKNARYCSRVCSRAARGHGLRHLREFSMFPQQCAICAVRANLVGDHDHATGAPRGILCRHCNLALGNMRDKPQYLRAAAAYLEKKRLRLYLAGPMSNYPELNFPAFHAEAARLRSLGIEIVNPAEINADTNPDWLTAMRADIRELVTCAGVAVMPRWTASRGAQIEVGLARQLGLPVYDAQSIIGLAVDFPVLSDSVLSEVA